MYQRHSRRIYTLAMRLTGWNHAEAQDVMQETFVRALQAYNNYRDTGAETAWIRTICINLVREQYRRKRFFQDKIAPEVQREMAACRPVNHQQRNMEIKETQERIIAMLKQLPLPFREVLVLRHLEGRTTTETGEILNIPDGTVRSRLKRARQMIMDRI